MSGCKCNPVIENSIIAVSKHLIYNTRIIKRFNNSMIKCQIFQNPPSTCNILESFKYGNVEFVQQIII